MEKMGKGTSNPARVESRRIRSKEGGVAPASLPLFESGTSRILLNVQKIQRVCRLEGGSHLF